jgi:phosphate transport system substrate-binding protein
MRTQLKKLLWMVPGALLLMVAHHANAQDLSKMSTREMLLKIRTMNAGQMNQIVRSMDRHAMAQILQSMDSQTISQVVRSLDPNTMSEIAKRISDEFTRVRPIFVAETSRGSESQPRPSARRNEISAAPLAGPELQNRAQDGHVPEEVLDEQMNLTGMAVITHPSNPVDELTKDQIRKIYTGEYDNWSQVGGPNLPVKVMTVAETPGVQAKPTANASVSTFASSVFLGVASTSGAVGFVSLMQSRQLRFIGGHDAVKSIAVRIEMLTQRVKTAHPS